MPHWEMAAQYATSRVFSMWHEYRARNQGANVVGFNPWIVAALVRLKFSLLTLSTSPSSPFENRRDNNLPIADAVSLIPTLHLPSILLTVPMWLSRVHSMWVKTGPSWAKLGLATWPALAKRMSWSVGVPVLEPTSQGMYLALLPLPGKKHAWPTGPKERTRLQGREDSGFLDHMWKTASTI